MKLQVILTVIALLAFSQACKKQSQTTSPPAPMAVNPTTAPEPTIALSGETPGDFVKHTFTSGDATVMTPANWAEVSPPPGESKTNTVVMTRIDCACALKFVSTDGTTLEEAMSQGRQEFAGAGAERNAQILHSEFIKIPAGIVARLVTDMTNTSGFRMRNYDVIFVRGTKVYMIDFRVPVEHYSLVERLFDQVTASLVIHPE